MQVSYAATLIPSAPISHAMMQAEFGRTIWSLLNLAQAILESFTQHLPDTYQAARSQHRSFSCACEAGTAATPPPTRQRSCGRAASVLPKFESLLPGGEAAAFACAAQTAPVASSSAQGEFGRQRDRSWQWEPRSQRTRVSPLVSVAAEGHAKRFSYARPETQTATDRTQQSLTPARSGKFA